MLVSECGSSGRPVWVQVQSELQSEVQSVVPCRTTMRNRRCSGKWPPLKQSNAPQKASENTSGWTEERIVCVIYASLFGEKFRLNFLNMKSIVKIISLRWAILGMSLSEAIFALFYRESIRSKPNASKIESKIRQAISVCERIEKKRGTKVK